MKITGFLIMNSDGDEVRADPWGNNVAFCCERCGFPVLATALDNQRGSDEEHTAECQGCHAEYFLDVREQARKLYIHLMQREPK